MTIKLEVGKTYVTSGGYVVSIVGPTTYSSGSIFFGDKQHSPGISVSGDSIHKYVRNSNEGWIWKEDGSIKGLTKEWINKLTIVEELPFGLPQLPNGYTWKGGYPQFREPKIGETFIPMRMSGEKLRPDYGYLEYNGSNILSSSEKRRLIIEKVSVDTDTKSPLQLEVGKTYLSKGGYQVEIVAKDIGGFVASLGTSIGITYHGYTAPQYRSISKEGWHYNKNGSLRDDLQPEWNDKMTLVAEATKQEIPTSESEPEHTLTLKPNTWYMTKGGYYIFLNERLRSSPETSPGEDNYGRTIDDCSGGWYFAKNGIPDGVNNEWKDRLTIISETAPPPTLPDGYVWKEGFPKKSSLKQGDYYIPLAGSDVVHYSQYNSSNIEAYILTKNSPTQDTVVHSNRGEAPKEPVMSKKILSTVWSLTRRSAAYWIVEPVREIVTRLMRTVRYVVLFSAIAGGTYAYNNPDRVMETIKSCLPKISISVDKPQILAD